MRTALNDGLSTIAEFVPKLVAFLLILVIGLIVAKLISKALSITPTRSSPRPR